MPHLSTTSGRQSGSVGDPRPRLADHVYDHCVQVLRDPTLAASVAVAVLARPDRGRAYALARAREQALAEAGDAPSADVGVEPADLVDLACLLAHTRPADERAVIDLAVRHDLNRAGLGRALGLDLNRAGLGRALGLAPARAAASAAETAETWERELGPALLAWLGPGECGALAGLLTARALDTERVAGETTEAAGDHDDRAVTLPPPTLARLLDAVPAVRAHVADCETCSDRSRSMTSVRSLLAQVPIALAPEAVAARAPAGAGRWRVSPHPPPLRARRPWVRALAGLVVAALLAGGVAAVLSRRTTRPNSTVAALIKVPSTNALRVTPGAARPGQVLVLVNTSDRSLRWRATATLGWVTVTPATGALAPAASVQVLLGVTPQAPEGDLRGHVTISADDGSAAQVELEGSVERPPTVAASIDRCTVTATAEDEGGEVASVELHWLGTGGEGSRTMLQTSAAYVAVLPGDAVPNAWWVVAADARGNQSRTPARPVDPTTC